MVIEIDEKAIETGVQQIDNISDGLEEAREKNSKNSIFDAIENAVDEEIVNPTLQRARQLARPHVGDRAQTIQPVTGEWVGDTYRAGLRSDNEVVLTHEYGSGKYSSTGPYVITPGPEKQALSFTIKGVPIAVEYVIHPGVRGKRFMQRAVRERQDEISQEAADEVQETLSEALDPKR